MRNSSLEIFLNTICRWLPGRDGVVQNITLARCCHCLVYRNCKSFSPGPRSNTNLSSAVSDIWQQWCSPIIWRTGRGKVEFWSDVILSACLEWSVGAREVFQNLPGWSVQYLKKAHTFYQEDTISSMGI